MCKKNHYLAYTLLNMSVVQSRKQKVAFLFAIILLPQSCMAIDLDSGNVQLYAELFSVLNIGVLVTSIISIKQYFFPGDNNRMPFHVFNLIFGVLFYSVSLPYLIVNKQYYEGYQELIPLDIIGKFFFSFTLSSASQWVTLLSFIINILYIKKYNRDFYESGMGLNVDKEPESLKDNAVGDTIEQNESKEITASHELMFDTSLEQGTQTEVEDRVISTNNEDTTEDK